MVSKRGRERPQWLIHVPFRNCFCNQQTHCHENACLVFKLEMTCIILNLHEEKEKHLLRPKHHAESFQTGHWPRLASNPPLCRWTCELHETNPPSTLTERHHFQPPSTFFLFPPPFFYCALQWAHAQRWRECMHVVCLTAEGSVCLRGIILTGLIRTERRHGLCHRKLSLFSM